MLVMAFLLELLLANLTGPVVAKLTNRSELDTI